MKFLTHFPKDKHFQEGKWVYFQEDSNEIIEAQARSGDSMNLVDFGEDLEFDTTSLNPAVEGAATRTRIETAETLDNQPHMLGEKAGNLMLKSQRESGSLTLRGVFNMHSPTGNWFLPDKAGMNTLNPVKWVIGTLNSKGPIVSAFKQNLDSIIKINEDSPLIGTTLTHAFLENNLEDTLKKVSTSKNTGLSLHSLDVLASSIDSFFPQSKDDYDRFEEELVDRLKSEETLKKGVRFFTLFYEQRVRFQAKVLRNQFERGYEQLLENIKAAREMQRRKVANISAKVGEFKGGIDERGDMDNAEAYWWMVTEITQNPDEFLNNPKETYFGIDWRKQFGCDKGKIGAVDFLDMLHDSGNTVHVVDMPAIQIAHHNNMRMMDNVRERDKNLKLSMEGFDFNKLRDHLYKTELDRDDGYKTTEQIVGLLAEGLHRSPLNINVETEVFKDNRSMYQSPMEKLAQLGAYILTNPTLLKPNSKDGLNSDILAGLKGYLFHKESKLSEQLESRGIKEVGSPWARHMALTSADNILTSADEIMSSTLMNLSENIGKMDARIEIDNILNELDSFSYSMEQFEKMLGISDADDENSLYSQITQSEREIMDNVLEFSDFAKSLKESVKTMQDERKKFIDEYATPDDPFIEEQNKTLLEQRKVMSEVTKDTGGGIGNMSGSGGNFDISDGVVGAATGAASGEGSGGTMFGMETSLSVMAKRMDDIYADIVKWKDKMSKREGVPFSVIDNPKDALSPFVTMTKNSISNLKKELGLGEGSETEIDTDRPTLNDLMRVEMAYEANDYMGDLSRKFLQSYNSQQWKRLVTKPIGFKLNQMHWGDTTHQTKFNPMATITNPHEPLRNLRMIPVPNGEEHPENVIYLENDDYFIKVIPPHLNSEGDQSNLFLYKKEDKDNTLNPFSAQPVAKGVVLSSSVENKTLRNNAHYEPLFKEYEKADS